MASNVVNAPTSPFVSPSRHIERGWFHWLTSNFMSVSPSGATLVDPIITGTITLNGVAITATATELNYTDGVTGPIQLQIDAVQVLAWMGL